MAEVLLHQVVEGERWDTIAYHYYGSAAQYGRIIEANLHLDITPSLPTGAIVLIPILEQAASSDVLQADEVPPWKR